MGNKKQYIRRLIEVDLPIKRISAHARREKSIRHGHISTLHIWWARRPLAACRAVLCAALWPDPADPLCPDSFRQQAKERMTDWSVKNLHNVGKESYSRFIKIQKKPEILENNEELKEALLDFIADYANWDNSNQTDYLETSRALTKYANEALNPVSGLNSLVVDPFAGGGAIPLEALRLGTDVFASDLNPVPALLNRITLEFIPKHGLELSGAIRKWGEWINEQAKKKVGQYYPKDSEGATPIAYLWARTIMCEGPGCGCEIPLMRSLWLAKKGKNSTALRMNTGNGNKQVIFEIIMNAKNSEVSEGTVRRGSATCPICSYTTPVTSWKHARKMEPVAS
jgi:adenine-specific DNA methylase